MGITKQSGEGLQTGGLKSGGLSGGLDNAPKAGSAFSSNGPKTVSNLDNAPKFGSAFSSNGPKSDVAEAYEPALSGSQGPEARFDALQEIIGARVDEGVGSMMFSSSGGTKISGFGGMFTVQGEESIRPSVSDVADEATLPRVPWTLASIDDEYYIRYPGKVFWGFGDLENEATIEDVEEEVTVEAGGGIFLHLTDLELDEPTLTLESGDFWDEYPKTFLTEKINFVDEVTEAWFPLWEFIDGEIEENDYGVQITEDIWARQINRTPNSVMIWGIHNPDADNTRLAVPVLVPLA